MTRTRLPNRRDQVSFSFDWAPGPGARPTQFIGSLGFDRTRRPLEVFLFCEKTTSALEAVGRDAAILVSLLLQHGGEFPEMRASVTREDDGTPASLVGKLLDEVERVTAEECADLLR